MSFLMVLWQLPVRVVFLSIDDICNLWISAIKCNFYWFTFFTIGIAFLIFYAFPLNAHCILYIIFCHITVINLIQSYHLNYIFLCGDKKVMYIQYVLYSVVYNISPHNGPSCLQHGQALQWLHTIFLNLNTQAWRMTTVTWMPRSALQSNRASSVVALRYRTSGKLSGSGVSISSVRLVRASSSTGLIHGMKE